MPNPLSAEYIIPGQSPESLAVPVIDQVAEARAQADRVYNLGAQTLSTVEVEIVPTPAAVIELAGRRDHLAALRRAALGEAA